MTLLTQSEQLATTPMPHATSPSRRRVVLPRIMSPRRHKQQQTTKSPSSSTSLLTDMLTARYNQRARTNDGDPIAMESPRTWTTTKKDLHVFTKTHPDDKAIDPKQSRKTKKDTARDGRMKPARSNPLDFMNAIDIAASNNDRLTDKTSPRRTRTAQRSAEPTHVYNDIVLSPGSSLVRSPSPLTPTFGIRSSPNVEERAKRGSRRCLVTNVSARLPSQQSLCHVPSGAYLTSVNGTTLSDIRLSDNHPPNKARSRTINQRGKSCRGTTTLQHSLPNACCAYNDASTLFRSTRGWTAGETRSNGDTGRTVRQECTVETYKHHDVAADAMETSMHSYYERQPELAPYEDRLEGDASGEDNDAESTRLALIEQENEMIMMALQLSLLDCGHDSS